MKKIAFLKVVLCVFAVIYFIFALVYIGVTIYWSLDWEKYLTRIILHSGFNALLEQLPYVKIMNFGCIIAFVGIIFASIYLFFILKNGLGTELYNQATLTYEETKQKRKTKKIAKLQAKIEKANSEINNIESDE